MMYSIILLNSVVVVFPVLFVSLWLFYLLVVVVYCLLVVVLAIFLLWLFSLCCHGYSVSFVYFFSLSLCRDCLFCTYTEFLGAFSLFFSVTVLLLTFLNFRCQCFFCFVCLLSSQSVLLLLFCLCCCRFLCLFSVPVLCSSCCCVVLFWPPRHRQSRRDAGKQKRQSSLTFPQLCGQLALIPQESES